MKIALFLGSFNPFHNGHLKAIKTALNDFKMDRVIIVPTMQNPWKEEKVLDINKRIEIINVSIYSSDIVIGHYIDGYYEKYDHGKWIEEKVPIFLDERTYIDSIEKELNPPYYSYATLHALKNKYCNDEIFILCGEDTIKDIPSLMNGGKILEDYNFLIVDRSKDSISSSYIRDRIKRGRTINECVSPNVIDLIYNYYKE